MLRLISLYLLVSLVFAAPAGTSIPFTVDDMLAVSNISISALSDDGQWLAATSSSLRDRIGVDNHRFGDPTYKRYEWRHGMPTSTVEEVRDYTQRILDWYEDHLKVKAAE
jgi:hypothetical protein